MDSSNRATELTQLGLLLLGVAVFYLVVIPAGVSDPEGLGMDEGLPPSFSPRLVALLAGALMLGRVIQLLMTRPRTGGEAVATAEPTPEEEQANGPIGWRSVVGVALALVFAIALVPAVGFVIGSGVLVPALLLTMGERRLLPLTVYPALLILGVWALFEQLLSIRLPAGALFAS